MVLIILIICIALVTVSVVASIPDIIKALKDKEK